ncbi:carcinoembryonic antigen-related cell adhesion molecule 2-like [Astyanax mexicanus]|uniref:Carcinoembryonic antigen-related cell adhesion molecule 2-like n=1 Tax=Astyanax mexicanus TaxID=7994 RepID=A0A8T2MHR4_ASTMX|nr:carcinoembryonic antigen-related cell adhesion molecule 2-like [Astyanax mexicanus]
MWTLSCSLKALKLIGPPENETLKEGDSVNLTCAVNCSLSSPQFVWFKNNQRLPSSDPVLHLPALTVNNSGSYSCALKTNEAVRSEIVRIHFEGVQSFSSLWGVNYTGPICAVRGSNVRILCSYSYPSLHEVETVRWCSMNSNEGVCFDPPYVYDSSSNSTSEGFQYVGNKQSNCTLLISNVQFSHSAEYRFRFITNEKVGRWTGDPGVTLRVGVKALKLTGLPESETLKEGDSVNLTCAVNCSLSSPQFVWFKDNQRLPSSDPVLHLPALTVEDSGNYSCALKTNESVRSEIVRIHFEGGSTCS